MTNQKYEPDIFYDVSRLSNEQSIKLLNEAKDLSYEWWVDILDCSKSLAINRTIVELNFFYICRREKT